MMKWTAATHEIRESWTDTLFLRGLLKKQVPEHWETSYFQDLNDLEEDED